MSDTQQVRLHILSEGATVIEVEPGSLVSDCLNKAEINHEDWSRYTFTINNETVSTTDTIPNSVGPVLLVASPEIDGGF